MTPGTFCIPAVVCISNLPLSCAIHGYFAPQCIQDECHQIYPITGLNTLGVWHFTDGPFYWLLFLTGISVIYSFWFIIIFISNNLAQSLNHSPKSWGNSIRRAHVIIGYHLVWESSPIPSPRKHLIFECISQPFSNLSLFSKRTPSCRDIIHHQSLYNTYPTYLQIFLNDIYITRGTPILSP